MRERRGLPIAAHLALLVALAFAAAYVVNLAVVLALPPRPPDVMRSDQLLALFENGYRTAAAESRAPRAQGVRFRIQSEKPRTDRIYPGRMLSRELAERLSLDRSQITISADDSPRDHFVYRVRTSTTQVEVHRFEHRITIDNSKAPAPPPPAPDPPNAAPIPSPSEAPAPPEPPVFAPPPQGVILLSGFEIGAALPDGRWLVMSQGRNAEEFSWIMRVVLIIGLTLLILTALALLFARRLARPIQNFSRAVQAVGVDPDSAAVAEQGPRELRGAARAVNDMASRLRTLVADRTQTLATVAHDMRTPLMRLRLAAENAPPEQRDKMAKEIGDIEALIASFIAFARDDPTQESRVRLDLSTLLQSIVDDQAETGRAVSFEGEQRLVVTGQALGLKRLFTNLIDNAVKYGAAARVTLKRDGAHAVVDIADDGPGIPAAQRETVFKPFVRLGAAAGGAGLGLPSARSIARAHGGDITIEDAVKGALLRTTLPL